MDTIVPPIVVTVQFIALWILTSHAFYLNRGETSPVKSGDFGLNLTDYGITVAIGIIFFPFIFWYRMGEAAVNTRNETNAYFSIYIAHAIKWMFTKMKTRFGESDVAMLVTVSTGFVVLHASNSDNFLHRTALAWSVADWIRCVAILLAMLGKKSLKIPQLIEIYVFLLAIPNLVHVYSNRQPEKWTLPWLWVTIILSYYTIESQALYLSKISCPTFTFHEIIHPLLETIHPNVLLIRDANENIDTIEGEEEQNDECDNTEDGEFSVGGDSVYSMEQIVEVNHDPTTDVEEVILFPSPSRSVASSPSPLPTPPPPRVPAPPLEVAEPIMAVLVNPPPPSPPPPPPPTIVTQSKRQRKKRT